MKKPQTILSLFFALFCFTAAAQETKTIYLMRERSTHGGGGKIGVYVNGQPVHKLKNRSRLVLTINTSDTIKVACAYPVNTKPKLVQYVILPTDNDEIYLNVFSWNDSPHTSAVLGGMFGVAGAVAGTIAEVNNSRVAIRQCGFKEGRSKFQNNALYKDKGNVEMIEMSF